MLTSKACTLLIARLALAVSLPLSVSLAQGKESKPPTGKVTNQGGVLIQQAVTKVDAVYPAIARAAKISGKVEVTIEIDQSGNVTSAEAISGHPLLKDSAVQAARQWKFKPTELSGQPVIVIGTLTFNFVLNDSKSNEKTASTKPDSADARFERGMELSKARRFDQAIAEFSEVVKLKPDYVYAHVQLGVAYMNAGRYREAEATCKHALTIQREDHRDEFDYTNAMMCLGMAELSLSKYSEAIEAFKKVAEINPKMVDVRMYLGLAFHRQGKDEEAIEFLKQSLALQPDYVNAHFLLAEIHLAHRRWKEAIDSYKRCLELGDGAWGPPSHYGLGIAFLKLGDKESAMNEYRALKKIGNARAEQLLLEINK